MSLPFLKALKALYPDATIYLIIKPEYEELLKRLPWEFKLLTFSKGKYGRGLGGVYKFVKNSDDLSNIDIYFCLPPSFSSAFMGRVIGARERIGYSGEMRGFLLSKKAARPQGVHRAQEYLNNLSIHSSKEYALKDFMVKLETKEPNKLQNYVVLNVNSEASSRRLPVEKWSEFIRAFEKQTFVFIGTEKEKIRAQEVIRLCNDTNNELVDLSGQTSIAQLVDLLGGAQAVISNDSGPAHLAAITGVPVLSFFGAGDPVNTAPIGRLVNIYQAKDMTCSPCLKNTCPINTLECLHQLEMQDPLNALKEILNSSN